MTGRADPDTGRMLQVQAASLRRLARLVAGGAAPSEVFATVAHEVAQVTGVALVLIQRYEAEDTVTVAGSWGRDPHPFQVGTRWDLRGSLIAARIKQTGEPVRVDDFGAGAGPIVEGVRKTGIRGGAGAPICVDGVLWGAISAGPAKGEPAPVGLEARLAEFTELVATAISTAHSREALARLADEQAALRRVATLVARGVPPAAVFQAVAREAGSLLGVDAMHIGRFDGGAAVSVGGWSLAGDQLPLGTRVELDGRNVASLVRRTGRPARIDGPSPPGGTTADRLRHRMHVVSSVAAPIVVSGRLWGLMIASSKRPEPLAADTESRLLAFTELAETAVANAQARTELAASRGRLLAAADEERRRVVRDLHDGAQQRLVHTVVTLKLAARELGDRDDTAASFVREALDQAERATTELRELAHGILPAALTQGGLAAGVEALAGRMSVPVVRDDGAGGARASGTGLVGLRDRLAAQDGTLVVDSPRDGGTLVAATIPLSPYR